MKISVAIVLLSVVSTSAFAQTFFPKAGVSFSWIATSDMSYNKHLNDEQNVKMRVGFTAGFGFNIPLDENISIQPELSFVQKGTIAKMSGGTGEPYDDSGIIYWETTRNIKINYVELPVLVKCSFGKKTKYFLNAGPALALGVGGTSTFESVTEYYSDVTSVYTLQGKVLFTGEEWQITPDDERFKSKYDLGFQLGGGILIFRRIMIDIRYTSGFINLYEPEPSSENNSKNRSLQMTIGFPLQM